MNTMTFEQVPSAIAELNRKVDHLTSLLGAKNLSEDNDTILIDEAAEMLSKSKATIYGLTHRRAIPHYKNGARLFFSRKELREYIKAGRVKTIEEIQADAVENLKRK